MIDRKMRRSDRELTREQAEQVLLLVAVEEFLYR